MSCRQTIYVAVRHSRGPDAIALLVLDLPLTRFSKILFHKVIAFPLINALNK